MKLTSIFLFLLPLLSLAAMEGDTEGLNDSEMIEVSDFC
jgi:hypothetical protein